MDCFIKSCKIFPAILLTGCFYSKLTLTPVDISLKIIEILNFKFTGWKIDKEIFKAICSF